MSEHLPHLRGIQQMGGVGDFQKLVHVGPHPTNVPDQNGNVGRRRLLDGGSPQNIPAVGFPGEARRICFLVYVRKLGLCKSDFDFLCSFEHDGLTCEGF